MNVDKVSFYPFILDILTDISESRFVAIDLELSGVPTKQIRHQAGKPSLQDRYAETKEAAERYQILQIGVTCVKQDVENGKYVLRPYNFDLSPIIQERGLDVERIFSFQSGACEFLLKAGFDMARPYTHGVPYLSRDESREARQKHAKRQDKSAMADIQIKPTEVESLAFLERVRTQINDWLAKRAKNSAGDSVEIIAAGAENVAEDQPVPELSRFERRLVHQLVRAEYPDFVTISRHTYIQIVPFDKAREERIAVQRRRELEERINRQKGFRWIVEALLGSDLSKIDLREVAKSPVTGDAVFADMDEYRAQFNRACGLLRGNPRVLVGHNCFLDLVYVYRTFIGELPPTVVEFQQKLHALWPTIVDTKYMSTHNCGDINPVSSLEQIATQLSDQAEPKLELDEHHRAYEKEER
ncbi:CAF1-domain-containing protein, partial [Hortaea werneckii]